MATHVLNGDRIGHTFNEQIHFYDKSTNQLKTFVRAVICWKREILESKLRNWAHVYFSGHKIYFAKFW